MYIKINVNSNLKFLLIVK